MVDMAHFAGLVAAGVFPSPLPHAHVVTTTTHKTLRGPRGGMVLPNDPEIGKKINSAVFPGLQGGPLMHVIAAKAVAFGEALRPEFKRLQQRSWTTPGAGRDAGRARASRSSRAAPTATSCWSTCARRSATGKAAEAALERARITVNKNTIPFDPEKPTVTSGVRLGSPAATTRGFGVAEFREIGQMIADVLDGIA